MARPTRSKTAAAAAAAAAPPSLATVLDGCNLAFVGNFTDYGYNQVSMEALATRLGARTFKSVAKAVTHLVSSELEYIIKPNKYHQARARDLPIVSPEWVLDCEAEKKLLDTHRYEWDTIQPSVKASAGPASANKGAQPAAAPAAAAPASSKRGAADADGEPEKKRKKVVAEGQFIKNDGHITPDEYCPLVSTHQVYVDPEDGLIWDASLNQANAGRNNNKFYRIQITHDPATGNFKTWTRWGRVGEVGQNALLGDGTLDSAKTNFKKKFRDKSGLAWEDREKDPKPNKYAFVEKSYNDDSDDEEDDEAEKKKATKTGDDGDVDMKEEEEEEDPEPECKLEKPVRDLMELIFNQNYFQNTMASLNYDANKLPLGKLGKTTITRGFQQLKDLAALLNDPSLATSRWNMSFGNARDHLSNTYYSVIPHDFGRNRPPTIGEERLLKKEVELLESLSDMKLATDMMKVDKKTRGTVHPLDAQFQGLGLDEMTPLDPKGDEHARLAAYLQGSRGATHNVSYKIQRIFRVERQGERERLGAFDVGAIGSDRRLLWHGSRCTNFAGILSQGLRIAPPEAPVTGYMFGKGIYLADMSSKSAGYCWSHSSGDNALLLLCEAELGDPMHELIDGVYSAGEDAKKKGLVSTLGMGANGPSKWIDAADVHKDLEGIKIPDPDTPPSDIRQRNCLYYNEYICYDVAQVRIRYLFQVRM